MDLVRDVTTRLSVDEDLAVRGLGALFIALRMTADPGTFTGIASAFPDCGRWMQRAPFQNGGTGEMLALATPGAVRRILLIAGFLDDQIPTLGGIVGQAVRPAIAEDAFEKITASLPLFAGQP